MEIAMYSVERFNNELILLENNEPIFSCSKFHGVEMLEFVAEQKGETIKDWVKTGHLVISVEIQNAFREARDRFLTDFPERFISKITQRTDTSYTYFYSAITDPQRIGAVTKKKYLERLRQFISEFIFNKFSQRETWLTLHCTKIKEGGLYQWLRENWINGNIEDMFPEDWLRTNEIMLKPGKALSCMMDDEEENIPVFAGYFQDEMNKLDPSGIEIKVSDTPSEIYVMGGNFQSCMRKDEEEYFKIYDDVEDCEIAYIVTEGELRARALLWHNVKDLDTGKTYKIMDRIYAENHKYLSAMILWATTHEYLHKTKQALNIDTYYTPKMEIITLKNLRVETTFIFYEEMYSLVPYVDTFQWVFCGNTGMHTEDIHDYGVCLADTDGNGEWLTGTIETCCECGGGIRRDDNFIDNNGNYWCDNCFDRFWVRCEHCDEWVHIETAEECTINGEETVWLCNYCKNDHYWYEGWSSSYWDEDHTLRVTNRFRETISISTERFENEGCWDECDDCGAFMHDNCLGDFNGHYICEKCEQRRRENGEVENEAA